MVERERETVRCCRKPGKNLWQRLATKELAWQLSRCICVEKQKFDEYSDYEKFRCFFTKRAMLLGTLAEQRFRIGWETLFDGALSYPSLSMTAEQCRVLWREAHIRLDSTTADEQNNEGLAVAFCDEKRQIQTKIRREIERDEKEQNRAFFFTLDRYLSEGDLCAFSLEAHPLQILFDSIWNQDFLLFEFDLTGRSFLRPNPYAAEQVLLRRINGEKCKKEENNLLFYQILISLCEKIKREKIQSKVLIFQEDTRDTWQRLLDYCVMRDLQHPLLFAVTDPSAAEAVSPYALEVAFLCSEAESDEAAIERAKQIAEHLPIGGLVRNTEWLYSVMKNTKSKKSLQTLQALWQSYVEQDS